MNREVMAVQMSSRRVGSVCLSLTGPSLVLGLTPHIHLKARAMGPITCCDLALRSGYLSDFTLLRKGKSRGLSKEEERGCQRRMEKGVKWEERNSCLYALGGEGSRRIR